MTWARRDLSHGVLTALERKLEAMVVCEASIQGCGSVLAG